MNFWTYCSDWLDPVSRRLPLDAIRQNLNRQVEKPYLGAVRLYLPFGDANSKRFAFTARC